MSSSKARGKLRAGAVVRAGHHDVAAGAARAGEGDEPAVVRCSALAVQPPARGRDDRVVAQVDQRPVWVEVENPDGLLPEGARARMTFAGKQSPGDRVAHRGRPGGP